MVTVRNNSPRAFKELVVTDGVEAYLLDIELGAFQEVSFNQQMTHNPVYIIDPNPQFRSTPGYFKEGTPVSAVTNYHLLGNHIKAFYAQPKTQEQFFQFFARQRSSQPGGFAEVAYNPDIQRTKRVSGTNFTDTRSGNA